MDHMRDQSGFIQLFGQLPLIPAGGFIRGYRDVLLLQPIHQHSDAGSRVVETSRRTIAGPYLEAVFTYVDTGHCYHRVLLIRISGS